MNSSRSVAPTELLLLYRRASELVEWKRLAFQMLISRADFLRNGLSFYRWNSMLACYYADLYNFPHQKERIYSGFVAFTCKKTGLSSEEVDRIFSSVDEKISSGDLRAVPEIVVEDTDNALCKRVSCGEIHYEMSLETVRQFKNDRYFTEVFLNYSLLNPESGLFWSIAKEAYAIAGKSNYGIKVLECFASPFNYNLDSFCSAFPSDQLLEYKPGVICYGDFFTYIEKLKAHSGPVRLIVNPPYTDLLINKVAEEVVSYMKLQPGAEFIAMLPDWTPQPGISKLLALEGSVSAHFASKQFNLFDAVHQKSIKPVGMKMLLIINLGGSLGLEDSQDMLSALQKVITVSAARIR